MDMIEKHKEALKKPVIYYHWVLNNYHKFSSNEIIVICEGDVDLSYYAELIDRQYPEKHILKCPVECKNNVIYIWENIDWNEYESKRVLFFVDRDFSYWADEPQFYDSNVYITDGYSFENDAVNEHMFIKCLEDFYGFANCTIAEKNNLISSYKNYWTIFINGSYELMAYAFWHYKTTGLHNSKNIKFSKCISFEEDKLWKKVIENDVYTKYFEKKLEIDEIDLKEIEAIINRFKKEEKNYSVRGKWCLDFMLNLLEYIMNNAKEFVPSLYENNMKEPKRLLNLSERGAMAILGPKINPPCSLVKFLKTNIG